MTPSPPLIVPGPLNKRLWHIAFNRLDAEVNEALVLGREHIYSGAEYAESAGTPLPDEVVRYYVERLASARCAARQLRVIPRDRHQHRAERTAQEPRLDLSILAIGGGKGVGEGAASTMRLVADNVQSHIIPEERSLGRRGGAVDSVWPALTPSWRPTVSDARA